MHLSCRPVVEHYAAYRGMGYDELRAALRTSPKRSGAATHNISGSGDLLDLGVAEMVAHWHRLLDDAHLEQGVFMGFAPGCEYMREVCRASIGRLHAFTSVVPTLPESPGLVREDIRDGFIGIKLYPAARQFHVNDPQARAVYDVASEMGVPVLIHFGFSTDPTADLAYANPLDLNPVARDYPDVDFVIAHFGAGYFQEVLALAYQLGNVLVDTSGTNNWVKYMPYELELTQVFERALATLGPERILFGTDSGGGASGYRVSVQETQLQVLDRVGVSDADRKLIMGENACRVMKLAHRPPPA